MLAVKFWKISNFTVREDSIPKNGEKSIFDVLTGNDEYGYHSISFDEDKFKKLFLLQIILI